MINCLLKGNVIEGVLMFIKKLMKFYWNVIDGFLIECDLKMIEGYGF